MSQTAGEEINGEGMQLEWDGRGVEKEDTPFLAPSLQFLLI